MQTQEQRQEALEVIAHKLEGINNSFATNSHSIYLWQKLCSLRQSVNSLIEQVESDLEQ